MRIQETIYFKRRGLKKLIQLHNIKNKLLTFGKFLMNNYSIIFYFKISLRVNNRMSRVLRYLYSHIYLLIKSSRS